MDNIHRRDASFVNNRAIHASNERICESLGRVQGKRERCEFRYFCAHRPCPESEEYVECAAHNVAAWHGKSLLRHTQALLGATTKGDAYPSYVFLDLRQMPEIFLKP